jgi:outer membrane receptor protein involved in Fe transport
MYQKKGLSLAVSASLGLSTFLMIPASVLAQDQTSDEADDEFLEEVIVTGSRLVSDDGFGRTSPVTVVGLEDISATGLTRVEDVLNSLPSIEASQNSFISNGSTGTATIDLRGLGTQRTLVLINGRRMQPGGVFVQAPDVNQIPATMIERVEVLTGGASATYGADAVAGVVNFIMRRVDGVEVSFGASAYQHDNSNSYIQGLMDERNFSYPTGSSGLDGEAYNFDFVVGGDFAGGRGNATIYATWRKNNELRQEARDYASCALNDQGTSCGGSANAIVPNFFIYPINDDGSFNFDQRNDFFSLQPDSTLADWDGTNRYNYNPINHFQRPDERWSAGAFIDFEISENFVAYLETGFTNDKTRAQIAESGTFFVEPYILPLDNSVFSEGFRSSLVSEFPGYDEFAVYVGKRNVEGGPRTNVYDHSAFRIVTGVRGRLWGNWDYDISYLTAQTSSTSTYVNDFLAPSITVAVAGEACAATPGCIPSEVFTYQGVTPEMAAGLTGIGIAAGQTGTEVFNAYATGDLGFGLPAGDIAIAGGYEKRKEKFERISDTVYEEGLLLGQGGATPSLGGRYTVDELFVEGNVPLLAGKTFAENMVLDLAYRYSDYSTGFTTNTYRFGVDWQTVDALRLRAGYNRAVRAPNIGELFAVQSLGLWTGVDGCAGIIDTGENPLYSPEQCARTGVSASQYGRISRSPAGQYNAIYGGNPDLNPEKADTITAGAVIIPTSNMQISIDYWDIKIEDTIANIDPEITLELCAVDNINCDLITRAPNGSLWQGQQGFIEATQQNIGEQRWTGVDLAWNWTIDGLGGTWDFDLIGTYMLTKETTPIAGDDTTTYDCVGLANVQCYPTPEWRHVASATYDSGNWWAATARWRHFGDVDYDGGVDTLASDALKSQNYLDLNAVFRFMENHDVIVGVNNVLDEETPIVGGSISDNANTFVMYDTLGRYLYGRVTLRW